MNWQNIIETLASGIIRSIKLIDNIGDGVPKIALRFFPFCGNIRVRVVNHGVSGQTESGIIWHLQLAEIKAVVGFFCAL